MFLGGDGGLCIAVMLQLCVFRGGWKFVYCCNAAVVCVFLGGDGGLCIAVMLQLCVFLGGDGSLCIAVMLQLCVCF